jgi:20S proteasome subunit beta 6
MAALTSSREQIYFKNQQPPPGGTHPQHLPLPDVVALVIDAFTGATERHIEVGDGLEIFVVLARGRGTAGLERLPHVEEVTPGALPSSEGEGEGERVFVIRRDLKKD